MISLQKGTSVTLDANGRGLLTTGPERAQEQWRIRRLSTSGNSTSEPECNVYRGVESTTTVIDTTRTGNGDISETDLQLFSGDKLIVVWSGGSPGAIMSFRLEGEVER